MESPCYHNYFPPHTPKFKRLTTSQELTPRRHTDKMHCRDTHVTSSKIYLLYGQHSCFIQEILKPNHCLHSNKLMHVCFPASRSSLFLNKLWTQNPSLLSTTSYKTQTLSSFLCSLLADLTKSPPTAKEHHLHLCSSSACFGSASKNDF